MPTKRRSRGLPSRIRWELFDPMDGLTLMSVDAPVASVGDCRRWRRVIQHAPAHMKPLGRPDGKPIARRTLSPEGADR